MKSPNLTTARFTKTCSTNVAYALVLSVVMLITANHVSSKERSWIAPTPVEHNNAVNWPTQHGGHQWGNVKVGVGNIYYHKGYISYSLIANMACNAPEFTTCPSNMDASTSSYSCDGPAYYSPGITGTSPDVTYIFSGATIDTGYGDGSGEIFNIGETTVTITASNVCGTSSCTFTVTMADNEVPSMTLDNVDIAADAGKCGAMNVDLGTPTTEDNCGVESIEHDAPSSFDVGITYVMWTVTDIHGNTNTYVRTVTVTDEEDPSISSPADLSISVDSGSCGATDVNLGNPTTDDNCGVESVDNDAPYTFDVGSTTVTWTVTDIHGNSSTSTQTVTVTDDEKPSITCPNDINISADAGSCASTNVNLGTPSTADNCGVESVENDAPTQFNVGTTTVTWTVTDIHGNTNTCTQTVTVSDDEKPSITCPSTVTASTGSNVSLGSPSTSDNCGVASVSNNAPSTYSSGNTTVTWTVTDIHGNTNTCTQTVTISSGSTPSCSIKVTPCNKTYTGGVPTDMYIGYGPSSSTLTASATGGSSFTYSWSGSYLNSTNKEATTFTPTAAGNYTLTCTVTNNSGNSSTCTVVICVKDIRASGNSNGSKVYICHESSSHGGGKKSQSLCVSVNAVPTHLSNHSGDRLGTCSQSCDGSKDEVDELIIEENEEGSVEFTVAPNPFVSEFRFGYESSFDQQAIIRIHDMTGRLVHTTTINGFQNTVSLGQDLSRGIYTLTFTQGSITKSVRIVKSE